jgi:hypothetical protein
MEREADGFRVDGRYERSLGAWLPGNSARAAWTAPAALASSLIASLPRGRAADRVLMAVRLRRQHGCPRWLTAGSDNFRHLPSSGQPAE